MAARRRSQSALPRVCQKPLPLVASFNVRGEGMIIRNAELRKAQGDVLRRVDVLVDRRRPRLPPMAGEPVRATARIANNRSRWSLRFGAG